MTTLQGATVLVTGAGGFIGSHLVEALVAEGATTRAFVHYNSRGDVGMLKWCPAATRARLVVEAGDLRDSDAVAAAVEGCDVVLHLGALIGIPYSYRHPREVVETNVMGTLNVLEACRRHRVARLVHTSTSEVYGTATRERIAEDHPLQGQSPYSASKIGADKLAESYLRSFELPVVVVRPFNTYGPRQSGRAVIPTIIKQVLEADHLKLGSLAPRRDFTFVTDTTRGFLLAATSEAALGHEINLGSDDDVSVGAVAEEIMRLAGRTVPIASESARVRPARSEVMRLHADTTRAHELLGWAPAVPRAAGLLETINWVRDHSELFDAEQYLV
jgi:NAD dependent epimerase/dehydratase